MSKDKAQGKQLRNGEGVFVEAYLTNGGNATRAYLAAHPEAKPTTARVEGCRLLTKPNIREEIERRRLEVFKRWEMEGEEALALLAARARFDPIDLFDEDGKLLSVRELPHYVRVCIKGIRKDGKGRRELVFHDGLKAAELVAIATGKLRSKVDINHNFDHAAHLAGLDKPPAETEG